MPNRFFLHRPPYGEWPHSPAESRTVAAEIEDRFFGEKPPINQGRLISALDKIYFHAVGGSNGWDKKSIKLGNSWYQARPVRQGFSLGKNVVATVFPENGSGGPEMSIDKKVPKVIRILDDFLDGEFVKPPETDPMFHLRWPNFQSDGPLVVETAPRQLTEAEQLQPEDPRWQQAAAIVLKVSNQFPDAA